MPIKSSGVYKLDEQPPVQVLAQDDDEYSDDFESYESDFEEESDEDKDP